MQSKAVTVEEYLASLPQDRRIAMTAVRDLVRNSIDDDIEEGMAYGMIGWYVPHRVFPDGYHTNPKQPLPYAALASQKNYMTLYMMNVYADGTEGESWFRKEWAKTGKKLDMGKSCIRFRKTDDLALDVIAEAIKRVPSGRHVEQYVETLASRRKPARKKA
jgi:hypothetical protein